MADHCINFKQENYQFKFRFLLVRKKNAELLSGNESFSGGMGGS
jgi:hypothetical protein